MSEISRLVIAIDPAELLILTKEKPKGERDNIIHIKKKASEAHEDLKPYIPVDFICCDMNIPNLDQMFGIIEPLTRHLKVGGFLLFTIKYLNKGGMKKDTHIESLKKFFPNFGEPVVKALIANKHEKTVLIQKLKELDN